MQTNMTDFQLFDLVETTLSSLQREESVIYTWNANLYTIINRLAIRLERQASGFFCDMKPSILSPVPDLALHDRCGDALMSIFVRKTYMSEKEQEMLLAARRAGKSRLVLGLSFIPDKSYILIYYPQAIRMEYLHYSKETKALFPLKTQDAKDLSKVLESQGLKALRISKKSK